MAGLCDTLVEEHTVIERVLGILETRIRGIEAGQPVDQSFFTGAIKFVREFADGVHHQKEESVLFPALCDAGLPKEAGPVGVMLYEHDEGRQYIRAMEAALPEAAAGDEASRSRLIEATLGYVNLLRAHIDKENFILFPMADNVLTGPQKETVTDGFEKAQARFEANSAACRKWAQEVAR